MQTAIEYFVDAAAMGADDVFAQVGITLTGEDLHRLQAVLGEILARHQPLPDEVLRLIERRHAAACE